MQLYRYAAVNSYLFSFLQTQQLYFQSPLNFNDPFDFDLNGLVIGPEATLENLLRAYLVGLEERVSSLDKLWIMNAARFDDCLADGDRTAVKTQIALLDSLSRYAGRERILIGQTIEDLTKANTSIRAVLTESWNSTRRRLAETYGVVCFSEVDSELLMWSHYADSHRGVCLEFDASERPIIGWKRWAYHSVCYSSNRVIDVAKIGIARAFELLLTTKSPDWSYERERRLITIMGRGEQNGRIQSLRGICFGMRVPGLDRHLREELYCACEAHMQRRRSLRALTFRYARKAASRFALTFRQLNGLEDLARFLDL